MTKYLSVSIFDQTKLLRVPLWIGHCQLCMKSHSKLRLQNVISNDPLFKKKRQSGMSNSQLYPWHLCLIKYELDIRGHCFLKLTRVPLWIGMSLYKWKVKTWNKKAADKKHLYFGFTKIWYYNCSILLVYTLQFAFIPLCQICTLTEEIVNTKQEIYRPGTTISHASNPCTAVGGVGADQSKEFRGNASFLREKGPRGGIRIYCYWIFHIDQKAKNQKYSL